MKKTLIALFVAWIAVGCGAKNSTSVTVNYTRFEEALLVAMNITSGSDINLVQKGTLEINKKITASIDSSKNVDVYTFAVDPLRKEPDTPVSINLSGTKDIKFLLFEVTDKGSGYNRIDSATGFFHNQSASLPYTDLEIMSRPLSRGTYVLALVSNEDNNEYLVTLSW